jgi:hypothetical protein
MNRKSTVTENQQLLGKQAYALDQDEDENRRRKSSMLSDDVLAHFNDFMTRAEGEMSQNPFHLPSVARSGLGFGARTSCSVLLVQSKREDTGEN